LSLHRIILLLWLVAAADGRSYYVATTGSDTAAGTLDAPFRTIQRAAAAAVAGDVVLVRGGVYRETVTPPRSGTQAAVIVFQPYNGESVTVSGADVIPATSWTVSSGKIYKAPVAWDLGEGENQLFSDGRMMIEARWPNTSLDLSRPTLALTGNGSYVDGSGGESTGTITGLDLPSRPAGYWNGATIHTSPFNVTYNQGPGWSWQTGKVVSATTTQLSFTWTRWVTVEVPNPLVPGPKNPYYLSGKHEELDAASEWFLEAGSVYFWPTAGDSPAQHQVEMKRRDVAFNLAGRSFITVQGFKIFAATINSDVNSSYLTLDGLQVQYVSHYSLMPTKSPHVVGLVNSGILLRGDYNVLRHSTVEFSAGNGVAVLGNGHRVFNNVIHDANYAGGYTSPIASASLPTDHAMIAWNTIYNAGRFGILYSSGGSTFTNGRIIHNDVSEYGLTSSDLGCIYTFGSDAHGTEVAYNFCHSATPQNLLMGVYLDFDSSNNVVHHNVVSGTQASLRMNTTSRNNRIYNNTFAASLQGLIANPGLDGVTQMPQSDIRNNIFTGSIGQNVNTSGALLQNNILQGTDPQFVDLARESFQLKSTSPAIGVGVAIPPYTDGFTGKNPDAGAYDHGLPAFKTGGEQAPAAVYSAASYAPALAPESIAVAFGSKLATGSADAGAGALPKTLAGTTVTITDGLGVDRAAPLFYVRPGQLAFEIPAETAPGVALITVTAGDGTIALGSTPIFSVAPSLFTANSSGTDVAAAQMVRVKPDGTQTVEAVATFDAAQKQFVPLPVDRGAATDQLALILYGTGIRNHAVTSTSVSAQTNGVSSQVLYAGAQGVYPGLDQVNLLLPRTLPAGTVNIAVIVDGIPANVVTIALR
jgi:uncharacterized protein (TIGR03437 family)